MWWSRSWRRCGLRIWIRTFKRSERRRRLGSRLMSGKERSRELKGRFRGEKSIWMWHRIFRLERLWGRLSRCLERISSLLILMRILWINLMDHRFCQNLKLMMQLLIEFRENKWFRSWWKNDDAELQASKGFTLQNSSMWLKIQDFFLKSRLDHNLQRRKEKRKRREVAVEVEHQVQRRKGRKVRKRRRSSFLFILMDLLIMVDQKQLILADEKLNCYDDSMEISFKLLKIRWTILVTFL